MVDFIPRQIIHPMRYISGGSDGSAAETQLVKALSAIVDDQRHVMALGRARAGIYLLVKHVITPDRRHVIMSPYTIPDVINMVKLAGAVPIFVDFLPNSTNVATQSIEQAVDARTAAVMLTHYHVNQNNMDEIVALCRTKNVALFDDCAISFGSCYDGTPIGCHTDGSIMSFSAFKLLNFIWGGAVSVRDDSLFAAMSAEAGQWPQLRLRQYRKQAAKTLFYSTVTSKALFPLFFRLRRPHAIGSAISDVFPLSRVETVELDATIRSRPHVNAIREWNDKLPSLASRIAHRRSIAAIYDIYFRNRAVSAETSDARRAESCFVNYPIVAGLEHRDSVYREMLRAGFDVGLSLYPNVHEVESFNDIEGSSANVSTLVRSILTLPTHSRIEVPYAHALAQQLVKLLPASMH